LGGSAGRWPGQALDPAFESSARTAWSAARGIGVWGHDPVEEVVQAVAATAVKIQGDADALLGEVAGEGGADPDSEDQMTESSLGAGSRGEVTPVRALAS